MSLAFEPSLASEQVAFNRWTLPFYDWLMEVTCDRVWQCPVQRTLKLYDRHLSANHLEVGVGTGYFLDRSHFPVTTPHLALLDVNRNCLRHTASRVARYDPVIYNANALSPLTLDSNRFDSIGLNYVLHCMPGSMSDKSAVFENLRPHLKDGGVLFGSTVLSKGLRRSLRARAAMNLYNASHVFCNANDSLNDLRKGLQTSFKEVWIDVIGCVAQFSARA